MRMNKTPSGNRLIQLSAILLNVVLFVSACGENRKLHSSLDTVQIPQTPVKNQGLIGFCWAYTTAAMLEAWTLKSGKEINISEEAIGFYRMAEELSTVSKDPELSAKLLNTSEIDEKFIRSFYVEGLQGGEVIYTEDLPGKKRTLSGFDIFLKYGAVPESVWSHKFQSEIDLVGITKRLVELMKSAPEGEPCCSIEEIATKVLVGSYAFATVPPREFDVNGLRFSSQEYFQSLNFDVSQYEAVTYSKDKVQSAAVVQRIKQALADGHSVPLEYPIVGKHFVKNVFKVIDGVPFAVPGTSGHVVLITDWVNQGGRPGRVSPEELDSAIKTDANSLDYFVFKNSWGRESVDENTAIPSGYYRIYKDYLDKSAKSKPVYNQPGYLFFVLPKQN